MDKEEEKIQENQPKEETIEEDEENELEEQEEFTYTVDNNNINNDYNNNEAKSYMYILVGFIVLAAIIIGLIVLVNKNDKKTSEYSGVESKLLEGAKKYYNKYQEQLPTIEGNYTTVTAETLIENSYLKPFSEMLENEDNCTGYVNVYKNSDEYAFFPFLECKEEYKSVKLNEKIIEENTVASSDGLYKDEKGYVYKGEYPNNYVKFDNKLWRIIRINTDGSIKLILIDKKTEKTVWDDRFNLDKSQYVGKNDFRISRMLDTLNDAYEKNTYVTSENKQLLVKENWCIGKISEENNPISTLNVCNDTYELYIGLVTVDEVLTPSLDETCKNIYDTQCTNYNYFFNITTGWTLNASIEKSYSVFNSTGAMIFTKNASTSSTITPVININGDVLYKSGNGTEETPYIIGK